MTDVDKIEDFDSYMTGMRRAKDNALIAVNDLNKCISDDGMRMIIGAEDWRAFVDKITKVDIGPEVSDAPTS